jgi:hypothetical protein
MGVVAADPAALLLAVQPELVTPVLQVVQRVVTRHLLDRAGLKADEGHGGAVTLIQRFGSAANLNVHLRCLVLDGVYRSGADGVPSFVEVDAPTDDELQVLLQTVITQLMKMLTRRGVLIEDMGQTYLAEPDDNGEEARTLRPLQAAAVTYRIAFGPRAGQTVLTLRGAMPRETTAHQPLCADIDGFSLHAAVRVEANDRKRLEQLCRHITRPAPSDERVQLNAAGQVELKLKTPWRDGTTHLVIARWSSCNGWRRWCHGRGCTSSGSMACWRRTPSCGRRWRRKRSPPKIGVQLGVGQVAMLALGAASLEVRESHQWFGPIAQALEGDRRRQVREVRQARVVPAARRQGFGSGLRQVCRGRWHSGRLG